MTDLAACGDDVVAEVEVIRAPSYPRSPKVVRSPTPASKEEAQWAISLRGARRTRLPEPTARVSRQWTRRPPRPQIGMPDDCSENGLPIPQTRAEMSMDCPYWTITYVREHEKGRFVGQSRPTATWVCELMDVVFSKAKPPAVVEKERASVRRKKGAAPPPRSAMEIITDALENDARQAGLRPLQVLFYSNAEYIYTELTPLAVDCRHLSSFFLVPCVVLDGHVLVDAHTSETA